MAIITDKPLVLITGATGHLGYRTLVLALEAGYQSRIAVRKAQQGEKIKKIKSIQPYLDDISFVQVPDITSASAYDSAIEGVDHVIHIASPIPTKPEHQSGSWQELYYDPAIKGTLSMLSAAAKTSKVKTVVITSSVGVLSVPAGKDRAGPSDLTPVPDAEAASEVSHWDAYKISKILSHAAATDFVKANAVGFKLVRVLPGYIQGPNELLETNEEFFTGSNEGTINAVLGNLAPFPKPTSQVFLDDAAKAHVVALDNDRVANGDVLVVVGNGGDSIPWEEVADVAGGLFPKAVEQGFLKLVKGQQNALMQYDVAGSEETLGFKFAGVQEMVRGLVKQYLEFHGHTAE